MPNANESLLIVDDEPIIRESFSLIFTEMGWRVRTAMDGFSALEGVR